MLAFPVLESMEMGDDSHGHLLNPDSHLMNY